MFSTSARVQKQVKSEVCFSTRYPSEWVQLQLSKLKKSTSYFSLLPDLTTNMKQNEAQIVIISTVCCFSCVNEVL